LGTPIARKLGTLKEMVNFRLLGSFLTRSDVLNGANPRINVTYFFLWGESNKTNMLLLSILYPYLQSVSPFLTQIYGVMFLFLAFLSVEVYRATNSKSTVEQPIAVNGDGGNFLSLSNKEEISKTDLNNILFIFSTGS
jgi:hypothetical protein